MSNITCFTCGQKYNTVTITNMYVQVTTVSFPTNLGHFSLCFFSCSVDDLCHFLTGCYSKKERDYINL